MATVKRSLSARVGADGRAEVLFRLSAGRGRVYRLRTGVRVPACRWNARTGALSVPRLPTPEGAETARLNALLSGLESRLVSWCGGAAARGEPVTRERLEAEVRSFHRPGHSTGEGEAVGTLLEDYAREKERSGTYAKGARQLVYDWRGYAARRGRDLPVGAVTADDLRDFERWLREDGTRGGNTVANVMRMLSVFFNRRVREGLLDASPFRRYAMPAMKFGTPYYLTVAERDRLYRTETGDPFTDTQRDVFVFQCLVGCRVSDLFRLTGSSVVDGAVEYVPVKTSGRSGRVVRVPLTATAREIVARYGARGGEPLLPFTTYHRYEAAIRRAFRAAGLTRAVTVLDPRTGRERQRPLDVIASSHLARRTFVGNLYRRVQDPALIGALSGHAEGSRSFARYRTIDEEARTRLVSLLEEDGRETPSE